VSATDAAYVGLGLAGASFVGTFFVAPQFKDAFKEELDWKAIYTALQQAGGVQQLDAGDAAAQSGRCVCRCGRVFATRVGGAQVVWLSVWGDTGVCCIGRVVSASASGAGWG
jgi:hypothetical protein